MYMQHQVNFDTIDTFYHTYQIVNFSKKDLILLMIEKHF